jgi:twitching motility protein PilT
MKLDDVFASAASRGASDIILSPGARAAIRVEGRLEYLASAELAADHTWNVLRALVAREALARFERERELETTLTTGGKRFRVTAYFRDGQPALALRTIPDQVATPDVLGLPPAVMNLAERAQGLVLFSGPAGQGKTTSLASIVDHMNHGSTRHIVTIEDPIEYLHRSQTCIIDQREVGRDTLGFEQGLLHLMRQSPDVIVIGEMRDAVTMRAAVTLAETGHLVLSTLHANDAPQALERVIDSFMPESRPQVRVQLSLALVGVVAQRLVEGRSGKRVLACEVLVSTPGVAALLREGKTEQLYSAMELEMALGMQSMNQALQRLVDERIVDASVAARYLVKQESRQPSRS